MIHKRPYDDEGVYEVACKHPRHWDNTNHFAPVVDLVPANNGYPSLSFSSGEDSSGRSQDDGRHSDNSVKTVSLELVNECESGTSGLGSKLWWAESDIIGFDLDSVTARNLSFFPEYFAPADQLGSLQHVDENCSSPHEYPSPSIGPEHQADVPEWRPRGNTSDCADGIYEERLLGTRVTPMPGLDWLADNVCQSYEHRRECNCPDHGSVRCIRQHVAEAREDLRRELGDDIFNMLGFGEMGETVSKKWTEEEEDMFHEVVHLNPARLGKNFWVQLSETFPSRMKMDLISYYFNVFMLRKRTEQNRSVPFHIDSDDDERHGLEEDEDGSGLDSLASQDAATSHQEVRTEICLEHILDDADAHKDIACASIYNLYNGENSCQPLDETACSTTDDYDNQNDSCVSCKDEKDKQRSTP